MPQARGSQTVLALIDESTYAADPGSPSGTRLYVKSSSVQMQQERTDSDIIDPNRARLRSMLGNIDVSGTIEMELSAENIGVLLKHALGAAVVSGTGPYTHTLTLSALPVGFILEQDYGPNIAGTGRYAKYRGCRVASASFRFPASGPCMASFSIKGATMTPRTAPLDATLTDTGCTPFSAFQAAILEGGGAIATVTDAEISIDNDLDGSAYCIGGGGVRRALSEGFATIAGSITALFEDASLLNKAVADTDSSLQITLTRGTGTGTAGNEYAQFLVQNLVYEPASPAVEGPRGILQKFNFRGFRSGAQNGLQVVLKNALASLAS